MLCESDQLYNGPEGDPSLLDASYDAENRDYSDFTLFWIILISSRVFAVILIRLFCACVRVPNVFPGFISARLGASPTDLFESFLGILTRSHLFLGLYESLEILCARMHPSGDVGHTLGSLLRGQPLGTFSTVRERLEHFNIPGDAWVTPLQGYR